MGIPDQVHHTRQKRHQLLLRRARIRTRLPQTGLIAALVASLALLVLVGVLALLVRRQPQVSAPGSASGAAAPAPQGDSLRAEQLALVINAADPLSEAIGRHYIAVRRLPARQVIRVRFPPARPSLSALQFHRLIREVRRRTPAGTQAYALAWLAPWRVECVSITSAFAFGRLRSSCRDTCAATPLNPWYARGDIRRPLPELGMRPTMLLAAATPQRARDLFRRGLAADGSAPPGTAYLLSSSDPIRNVRAAAYPAVLNLQAPGFQVRLLQADGLRGATDVMLLVAGARRLSDLGTIRFRPGAVADHLTSFGGVLTGPSGSAADGGNGQMSALRWLEAGATASYGTVVEPCNLPLKFPDPGLLLAYYRRGDTVLESYWRSVAMPDQGVFIGEPLARPWPAGARPRRAR